MNTARAIGDLLWLYLPAALLCVTGAAMCAALSLIGAISRARADLASAAPEDDPSTDEPT